MSIELSEREMRVLLAIAGNLGASRSEIGTIANLDEDEASDVIVMLDHAQLLDCTFGSQTLSAWGRDAVRQIRRHFEKKKRDDDVRRL